MDEKHVSKEEWQRYFVGIRQDEDTALRQKIENHAARCEACAALYQQAKKLYQAAGAYMQQSMNWQSDESAYSAVASFGERRMAEGAKGVFAVDIDVEGGEAVFLADTVETSGNARQYAVNPDDNGKRLEEDCQAFFLELKDGMLVIRVEEALQGKVQARMKTYRQTTEIPFDQGIARMPLEGDDIYMFEMTFAK